MVKLSHKSKKNLRKLYIGPAMEVRLIVMGLRISPPDGIIHIFRK